MSATNAKEVESKISENDVSFYVGEKSMGSMTSNSVVKDSNLVPASVEDSKPVIVEELLEKSRSIPLVSVTGSSHDLELHELVEKDLDSEKKSRIDQEDACDREEIILNGTRTTIVIEGAATEINGGTIVVDEEGINVEGDVVEEEIVKREGSIQEITEKQPSKEGEVEPEENSDRIQSFNGVEPDDGVELLESELDQVLSQESLMPEASVTLADVHLDVPSAEHVPHGEFDFDRDHWSDIYKQLLHERLNHQRKNVILQRLLFTHYKKRKLENVFSTNEQVTADQEAKYKKKLISYGDIKKLVESERSVAEESLKELKLEEDTLTDKVKKEFESLIDLERETAKGLIDSKTGKPLLTSVVERYLHQQINKTDELNRYRLAYIKLQDQINEIGSLMSSLDVLGDNLNMADYDQLRIENQNLSDKIEELEDELVKIRTDSQNMTHILAHVKEKSFHVVHATHYKQQELSDQEDKLAFARAEVNEWKRRRSKVQEQIDRENEEGGLLSKPVLLHDFSNSLETLAKMREELENLRNTCADEHQQLMDVRRAIERIHKKSEKSASKDHGSRKTNMISKFGLSKTISKRLI